MMIYYSTWPNKGTLCLSVCTPDLQKVIRIIENVQAGAELGQAQNKLGLDLTLIFCRFGLVELVGRFSFIGLIEKIWLIIYSVYIKNFIWFSPQSTNLF